MLSKELELLVALQDLDIMIKDVEDVKEIGFNVAGKKKLEAAREELTEKLAKPLLFRYEKLKKRYKRSIVPVKDDICLGCFMRVPTQLITRGRTDREVISCEGCGRVLYWYE